MVKSEKVNNYNLIKNFEELNELVISTGKSFKPSVPGLFHIYELKKEHPNFFGYLQNSEDLKERLSSKGWQDKASFNYSIIYPDKEIKLKFERIPLDELVTKSCATISKAKKISLYLVMEYKSLLLYLPQWRDFGLIQLKKTEIDFKRLEKTCRLSCREWRNSLVDCIPSRGY